VINRSKKINILYFFRVLLISTLAMSSLILLIFLLFNFSSLQFHEQALTNRLHLNLQIQERNIEKNLDIFESDLEYMKSDDRFRDFINARTAENKSRTEEAFLYFIKSHPKFYYQLRYIDISGNELIRIEKSDGIFSIAGIDSIQNKSDRYYFQDILSLKNNEIYLSPIDLNKEFGKVLQPLEPVLRLGSPVYSDEGEKKGILIFNIAATEFMEDTLLEDSAMEMDMKRQIFNPESYWLAGGGDSNWAFMFEEQSLQNMENKNMELWNTIMTEKSGDIKIKGNTYIWNTVYPLKEYWKTRKNNTIELAQLSVFWKIMLVIPEKEISDRIKKDTPERFQMWFWVWATVFLGSIFYSFIRARNHYYSRQIEILATKDELTGCLNRRTGVEILEKQIILSRRTKSFITVCFIDINDLKPVNDLMGHDQGDLLIKTTAEIIGGALRESDTICRMGGDEFLLILPDCDEQHADKILIRIEELIESRNNKKDLPFTISISRGLAEKSPDTGLKDTEELITRADQKMYENKRKFKLKRKETGKKSRN